MMCLTGNVVSEREINLDVTIKLSLTIFEEFEFYLPLVIWISSYVHSANMKTVLCTICKQGNQTKPLPALEGVSRFMTVTVFTFYGA